MANIALGTSFTGAFTAADPKRGSYSLDQYELTGLQDYQQLTIELTSTNTTTPLLINLIDTKTGNVVAAKEAAVNGQGKISLSSTTLPGGSYRLLVGGQSGSYTVSTVDGGKATSIVTPLTARNNGDGSKTDVGTVGSNGQFFSLASSNVDVDRFLLDVALGADPTKIYSIGTNATNQDILFKIDPGRTTADQVTQIGVVKDSANNVLSVNLNALAFGPNGKLYTIGSGANKLYTIDPTTAGATSVGDLPAEFLSSGDLVYDAAGSRFLAASVFQNLANSSTLWSIPIAAPATATKIGTIGFPGVKGLSFENGQLKGFTGGVANAVGDRITIDTTTGIGTLQNKIGNDPIAPINNGIGGADTIAISATTPPQTPFPVTVIAGTKGQSATQRTIDLTDYTGTLKTDITTTGDAAYTNNIGFYTVTDALTGAIDIGNGVTVKPGDAGYAKAAVTNAILRAGKNDSQLNQDIAGGSIYAPVVVAQGSLTDFINNNSSNSGDGSQIHAYFNYLGANPDNFEHFRLTSPNTFAVEDQYGGGDRDFNDLIVNLNIKTA